MTAGVSAARLAGLVPRGRDGRLGIASVCAAIALLAGSGAEAAEPGFTPVKVTAAPIPTFRSASGSSC